MKKLLILLLILASCSQAKRAQRHYESFIKLGGTTHVEYVTDTIVRNIKGINGKDSIIYEILYFKQPIINFPKSNVQIRQEQKTERKEIKVNGKVDIKQVKVNALTQRTKIRNDRKVKNVEKRQENKRMSFFDWIMLIIVSIFAFYIGRIYERKLN
tara:strand:+ start:128 stop:595 length:468 start_codon:yes stop_codon:yes gene_type:complete